MCVGLGSGFHMSYGMFNDEIIEDIEFDNSSQDKEYSWKQQAIEIGASEVELKKVENGFYTYEQIVNGYKHLDKFNKIVNSVDVANEKKLNYLINAAEDGCEVAIRMLLDAYVHGRYGLQANNPEGLNLAIKYADKRSEKAIDCLLDAYENGWYGDLKYDPEVFKLVTALAKDGNPRALDVFNQHKYKIKNKMPFRGVDIFFK